MKRSDINKMVNLQYVYSAMEILASAIDFGVNMLNIRTEEFVDIFFLTKTYRYYELRSPKYMVGISGRELMLEMLDKIKGEYKIKGNIDYVNFFKSKEYWAMYMITYYKYAKNISFKEIFNLLNISEIIKMYNTLHEASNDKFIDTVDRIIDKKINKNVRDNFINARSRKKLSQKELSEISGINLRTLQKYESGEKDIYKAEYASIRRLKKVLFG